MSAIFRLFWNTCHAKYNEVNLAVVFLILPPLLFCSRPMDLPWAVTTKRNRTRTCLSLFQFVVWCGSKSQENGLLSPRFGHRSTCCIVQAEDPLPLQQAYLSPALCYAQRRGSWHSAWLCPVPVTFCVVWQYKLFAVLLFSVFSSQPSESALWACCTKSKVLDV